MKQQCAQLSVRSMISEGAQPHLKEQWSLLLLLLLMVVDCINDADSRGQDTLFWECRQTLSGVGRWPMMTGWLATIHSAITQPSAAEPLLACPLACLKERERFSGHCRLSVSLAVARFGTQK